MSLVSPTLVEKHVATSPLLKRAWELLTSDDEVSELLRMSNVMAVERLLYNDHGPVHAAIVTGSALEIMDILLEYGIQPSSLAQGTVDNVDEAKLIVMMAAYLHDIGNAVHRTNHELIGAMLAKDILDRLLPQILDYASPRLIYRVRSEVMHAIYATAYDVQALTIEASIVKVADATDMAEGRARIPYSRGKTDMHAISALSIKEVSIERGSIRPLRIVVKMTDYAGLFQIEKVMMPKIRSSLIEDYIEIVPVILSRDKPQLQPIFP